MTRTETIKDKIRLDILSGALPQGEKLTLSFLSKRYVSSHMPVREALRALNGEGLVTFEANQGATIRAIDANFIETIFEVRCAIEGLAARKAISQISEADIAQLQLHQRELEKAALAQDGQAVFKNNRLFHDVIHKASGLSYVGEISQIHSPLLGSLWTRLGYGAERLQGVILDHRLMIQLIEDRDAYSLEAIARAHVIKTKVALLKALKQGDLQAAAGLSVAKQGQASKP
jgi:DNA-binding GntR family transcriptional regulator